MPEILTGATLAVLLRLVALGLLAWRAGRRRSGESLALAGLAALMVVEVWSAQGASGGAMPAVSWWLGGVLLGLALVLVGRDVVAQGQTSANEETEPTVSTVDPSPRSPASVSTAPVKAASVKAASVKAASGSTVPVRATPAVENLARTFHVSPDAVTLSSVADGRFREVNEGFRRVTGYGRDEVLGRTSGDLGLWVDPADRDALLETLERQERVVGREVRFRRRDGRVIDCQVAAEIVELEGEPNLLFLVRDVTRQKRVRARQEEIVAEIETVSLRLERFYQTLAHELRSPLVTIRGFLGLLGKDLEAGDTERVARDMERIAGATEHMHRSLDDLLELASLGRYAGVRGEVDLQAVLADVLAELQPTLVAVGATVTIEPGIPRVYGQSTRLAELLRHLIENAVLHTRTTESGAGAEPTTPRVVVGVRPGAAGACEMFVRDNGPGIDPQYQERIFDLFERLDPATSGTGLGLALARRIVELHGGRLWVESELGAGATFVFTLPVGEPRPPKASTLELGPDPKPSTPGTSEVLLDDLNPS